MEIKFPFTEEIAVRFDTLYQWLNRRYRLQETTVQVAGQTFRLFTIPEVDAVIDRILETSEKPDEEIPYWAELWPSAVALAEFLPRHASLKNKQVLELGSGLGLVGILAGKLGARITLSDYLDDALRICELNWIFNFGTLPSLLQLDWRTPHTGEKFEVILASDVAYERRMFWPLITTFQTVLEEQGIIYLSEPNRPLAKNFFNMLREEGFSFEKYLQPVSYRGKEITISIYTIHKS